MAKLTTAQRKKLPKSAFVFPDKAPGSGSYPIHDLAHGKNALARSSGKPEEGAVRAAVLRRYPELKKFESLVPLLKDDARQIVYGVVLSPDVEDSQGDVVSADEIEKAAHRFLVDFRKHDVQHDGDEAAVETVESFIAPTDFEIDGQEVLKGSWVMATHVSDPDVWTQVQKGEITGYSIGGSGERTYDEDE